MTHILNISLEKIKTLIMISIVSLLCSCESDDDNSCPDIIPIVTQEDLELAERCGLEPAGPLGKYWVSENYKLSNKVQ